MKTNGDQEKLNPPFWNPAYGPDEVAIIAVCNSFLQVCVNLFPLLSSSDWERLGVSAIGDRLVLIQLSKPSGGKK